MLTHGAGHRRPELSGFYRDTVPIVVTTLTRKVVSSVGRFPGSEALIQLDRDKGRIRSVSVSRPPFARISRFGVVDSLVYVATSDRYEIDLYAKSGSLVRRLRRAHRTETVTAVDRRRSVERQVAQLKNSSVDAGLKERLTEAARAMPVPETKPAYDRVVVRSNGELWVRDYLEPYERERRGRWSVFSPDGSWLTTVELPIGLEPSVIGEDFILGTWLDQDDVPHVRLHRLTRR
jgi:hypothetical protein